MKAGQDTKGRPLGSSVRSPAVEPAAGEALVTAGAGLDA